MGLDAKALIRVLHAAHLHDVSRQDLLQLACERIRAAGAPYTSVYAYMLAGDELVLDAHAGRDTEHVRIAVGTGVCGTAVATGADQNVADVGAIGNYLACNLDTKSELVVLIRRGGENLGRPGIHSGVPAGFGPAEPAGVKDGPGPVAGPALARPPPASTRSVSPRRHPPPPRAD